MLTYTLEEGRRAEALMEEKNMNRKQKLKSKQENPKET